MPLYFPGQSHRGLFGQPLKSGGLYTPGVTGSAPAVTLVSISVSPNPATLPFSGGALQFAATGTFSDSSTSDVTSTSTWTSSNSSIFTVNSTGLVTPVHSGSAFVTASIGGVAGVAAITVTNALVSISVSPNPATLPFAGGALQFAATGTYDDGTVLQVANAATWTSSNTNTATVNGTGLVTPSHSGSTFVTASIGGIFGTSVVTVTNQLVSIAISPNPATLPFSGGALQFAATGTYNDGTTQPLASVATWTSQNTNVATVNGTGLVTPVHSGTIFVSASVGAVLATSSVTVTTALVSISVSPSSPTWQPLSSSDRFQFAATGTWDDGVTQIITNSVTWTSSATASITISNAGGTNGQATAISVTSSVAAPSIIIATQGAVSGGTKMFLDTDRDTTSNIRVPGSKFQWQLGGYGCDGIYLCQETTGNLFDTIGTMTLTGSAVSPLYQQTVTGWTRKGVGFSGLLNQRFSNLNTQGVSPSGADIFWCWYMDMQVTSSTSRSVMGYGTNNVIFQINNGALRRSIPGSAVDDTTTRPDLDDVVHPIGMLTSFTISAAKLYTDDAKTTAVYSNVTDGNQVKCLGAPAATTSPDAPCRAVYGFRLTGSDAQLTDAAAKSLYQWLGWTVPWS